MRLLLISTIAALMGCVISCRSTRANVANQPIEQRSRTTKHEQTYRESALRDITKRADQLIQAGIRYFNSGHLQDALDRFMEAHRILERMDSSIPNVRNRLNRVTSYLSEIHSKNSGMVLRYAKGLIELGRQMLNVQMLDSAEALLESTKRWQPGLRNEVNSLLRKVRDAKRDVQKRKTHSGY